MLYITIVIYGDFTGIKGSCITNVIKFQNNRSELQSQLRGFGIFYIFYILRYIIMIISIIYPILNKLL